MKKLFVLFAAATLFVGMEACKEKQDETVTEETVTEEVPVEDVAVDEIEGDSATVVVEEVAEETHAE